MLRREPCERRNTQGLSLATSSAPVRPSCSASSGPASCTARRSPATWARGGVTVSYRIVVALWTWLHGLLRAAALPPGAEVRVAPRRGATRCSTATPAQPDAFPAADAAALVCAPGASDVVPIGGSSPLPLRHCYVRGFVPVRPPASSGRASMPDRCGAIHGPCFLAAPAARQTAWKVQGQTCGGRMAAASYSVPTPCILHSCVCSRGPSMPPRASMPGRAGHPWPASFSPRGGQGLHAREQRPHPCGRRPKTLARNAAPETPHRTPLRHAKTHATPHRPNHRPDPRSSILGHPGASPNCPPRRQLPLTRTLRQMYTIRNRGSRPRTGRPRRTRPPPRPPPHERPNPRPLAATIGLRTPRRCLRHRHRHRRRYRMPSI